MSRRVVAPRLAGVALALAAGCGLPVPPPLTRLAGVAPEGDAVPPELARIEVAFSGPVDREGIVDGARLVLVPAAAAREALAAVESEEGARGLAAAVMAPAALEEGGRRAVLSPAAPLRARAAYAVVIGSGLRDVGGELVLDAEGRRRPTVHVFTTGAAAGPPGRPVLTEVRVDAETPEAGGEYVEVANLGEGPLDLAGHRLAKRTASGAVSSCVIEAPDAPAAPGEVVLLAGGDWDGRYALPPGVAVLRCGASALAGGLANDRPPALTLVDPTGAAVTTLGAAGLPVCAGAVVRLEPEGADAPENLKCLEEGGTPGSL